MAIFHGNVMTEWCLWCFQRCCR